MTSNSRYQLKGGTFVVYEDGRASPGVDIIDQALAEADIPLLPAPVPSPAPEDWTRDHTPNHHSNHTSTHHPQNAQFGPRLNMEGHGDYTQGGSDYGQEYPSGQPPYYGQPQQPQQYYAASSSSNTSPGSPSTYAPIYSSVSQYASSNPGYQAPGGYGYEQSQNYTHTSASASATLTENEAELKRLRNTAASARFRAKKKKREQSLERQSREKREELQRLENRISELEQENKFLKSLILTPRSSKADEEDEIVVDDGGSPKGKGKERSQGSGERRGGKGKDGVGTSKN